MRQRGRRGRKVRIELSCAVCVDVTLNECAQRKLRSTNEILNELGDEGWQLASSRPAVFGFLGMTWTVGFDMVFQREKVGPPSTGQGAPANG